MEERTDVAQEAMSPPAAAQPQLVEPDGHGPQPDDLGGKLREIAARALRRGRLNRGWTREHAAKVFREAIGIPGEPNTWRRWERGEFENGYPVIVLLAAPRITGMSLAELVAGESWADSSEESLGARMARLERQIESLVSTVNMLRGGAAAAMPYLDELPREPLPASQGKTSGRRRSRFQG